MAIADVIQNYVFPNIEYETRIYFWYLTWAAFSIIQPALITLVHWYFGVFLSSSVRALFILMAINAFLNVLLFIDRNIIALNDFNGVNLNPRTEAWLLWDIYSVGINVNIWFLIFMLFSKGFFKDRLIWILLSYLFCWFVFWL
ncbi:hypothetical protein [Pseudoalteromonas sp. NBT06-2]|uniref:hypothetical protein n=1 Tax=Pseudoalteromonas sp. NBT06-2 TaxID=2025950 RepID=UPI0011410BF5|nr:hypothetical protein [Pseudoalteromonas sp. NBT06-2]